MMRRLCLATDSLEPSGVGEHMLALAGEWRGRYDVTLACPVSPGGRTLLQRAARLGVAIKRLDDDPDAVVRWLRAGGYDLLHVHAGIGWEGHALAVQGRAAGIAVIVRTEHLPDVITDPQQRLDHVAGIARVDHVICVSDAAASTFRAAGIDPAKLSVIRNGLPVQAARQARHDTRRSLGFDEQCPVIVTTARLTPQKDHATLIGALPAVLARHPACRIWLIGTGPQEDLLKEQALALGVSDAISFMGYRADVPDLLAAADLFVLPSRFEGLPLAMLEAMAHGLPVVATRVGGTDEVLLDGVTGRFVEPGDPETLAVAIGDVLADPDRARALGLEGRARFFDAFTASRMADETARLFHELGVSPRAQQRMVTMDGAETARTRIGFIGAGGIAQRHLGILEQFGDVELAAFADPVEERAQGAAERFGARAFTDLETMLAEVPLDALYICVPPFAHGAPERAALKRGLPFFVEKPLALALATAEALAREVDAAGLVTGVGYHWRYLDTTDEAKAVLADNPAQFLSGYWLDSTPPPQWWWKQDQSGGQINEQTTHIVDLAHYLVGDVTQVFGAASHMPRPDFPGLDVATASSATLKFASGAVGNIGSTCLLGWNHRVGLHLFGDRLAIEMTDHDIMVDVGRGRPYRHADGDPVWRQDRDFIDAVRGGENRIRCPYGEALKTLRITDAIRRSIETGRSVDLGSQNG